MAADEPVKATVGLYHTPALWQQGRFHHHQTKAGLPMLLIYKIAMLAEIKKVRSLTRAEQNELREYRRDLIDISMIAQQAGDWNWLHEICGQIEAVNAILGGEFREI